MYGLSPAAGARYRGLTATGAHREGQSMDGREAVLERHDCWLIAGAEYTLIMT